MDHLEPQSGLQAVPSSGPQHKTRNGAPNGTPNGETNGAPNGAPNGTTNGTTNGETSTSPIRVVSLAIETTGKCNLRCSHCYAESGPELPNIPFRRNAAILRDLAANHDQIAVNFKGGEPLLSPDFAELLELAASFGFRMTVTTNGTLLTRAFVERVRSLPRLKFYVSVDGPTSEENDRLRGAGSFARIERGLSLLRAAGTPFSLSAVVTATNAPRVLETSRFARQVGAELLQLVKFQPAGRGRDMPELDLTPDQFAAAAEQLAGELPAVTTLYDEAVVFSCDANARYRFFQNALAGDSVPRMFTLSATDDLMVSHIRLKVGTVNRDGQVSRLMRDAQKDIDVLQQYAAWLPTRLAAMRRLRARLGLADSP